MNFAGKYTFIPTNTEVFSTKNLTNAKIPVPRARSRHVGNCTARAIGKEASAEY